MLWYAFGSEVGALSNVAPEYSISLEKEYTKRKIVGRPIYNTIMQNCPIMSSVAFFRIE